MRSGYRLLQPPAMPRPLNFREIEAFRAVMQTGTTTAAAAVLNTTQPSVSRLLSQVGMATGLKLFDNTKGRLLPTKEAKDLFDFVQRQFLGLDRVEQHVAHLRKSGSGSLRIGCTPALGLSVLPRVIGELCRRHPDVHVDLQTTSAHHLREGLLHGNFDAVLSTAAQPHQELDGTVLQQAPMVCVMHPGHALAGRPLVHVQDLKGQSLLTLNADDESQMRIQRLLQEHGVEVGTRVVTSYSFTICLMAAEGAGIGIVNPYIASVFARELHVAPLVPRCNAQVLIAFPQHVSRSRMVEEFTALMGAQLQAFGQA